MRNLLATFAAADRSISRKLTATLVAAVLAAMTVVTAGAVWQEAQRHIQAKHDYLAATAAVFASATSRATAASDANAALAAMRAVSRAPSLIYARIEGRNGAPLAEIGTGIRLNTDALVRSGDRLSVWSALGSRTLSVAEPVVHGGAVVGRVVLVADNADLLPRLAQTLAQTLLATAIALLGAVLIATRMTHAIVRPLVKLTTTVRHISASHDYTARASVESNDEVGELCGGFNAMLSEIEVRERKIIDLALHDVESDLPNRLAFERAIEARITAGRQFAVAAVGVDRFQMVRGVVGYRLTNELLGEIGARLTENGAVARISTDVIGCLLDVADDDAARQKAAIVLLQAEEPVRLGVGQFDVNVSIGLATFGAHGDTPQLLVERASIALDQARARRAKVHIFDQTDYTRTASNALLMGDLLRAIHNGELSIHLQPKYDLRERTIVGAEALARWRHPEHGHVSPDVFIGMAEETGAIAVITEWSLRRAIAAQMRLSGETGMTPTISVNLSARLLDDAAFIAMARRLLDEAPGRICLEITETASIDNQEAALRNIAALKDAGAMIAIDDYGQGLSSLSYLRRIPAQELKIDKAFVQLLGEQQRDALMVKSTIDLAHSLGMKVTAEGVETEAALGLLAAMGCDMAQGYLIARPMTEVDFARFLREWEHTSPLAQWQAGQDLVANG